MLARHLPTVMANAADNQQEHCRDPPTAGRHSMHCAGETSGGRRPHPADLVCTGRADRMLASPDHDGYHGVMLDLPGTGTHLEFTATEHIAPPVAHVEDLLVLYLGTRLEVDRVIARAGAQPVPSVNPYWDRVGVTIVDPDGSGSCWWPDLGLTDLSPPTRVWG